MTAGLFSKIFPKHHVMSVLPLRKSAESGQLGSAYRNDTSSHLNLLLLMRVPNRFAGISLPKFVFKI